jgi:branched-chain amino acid transport system permease protein
MLQYVIAGLALGSIYAIAASGLVVTYASAGILNFSYGSMAFVIALLDYDLRNNHGWSDAAALVVSLLVAAPLLGVLLWAIVFRLLRNSAQVVKVVATIGLSVALPQIGYLIFGQQAILSAPGLAPTPVKVFQIGGSTVNMNQVIIYGCLLVIVVGGTAVLRLTDVGLRVRAMVDSEALTSLSGVNPQRVSIGVWAIAAMLAGLAGLLVMPTQGVDLGAMTTLMASAFAAVVAARLRNLPVAVGVALAIGVVTDVSQKYLPANSQWTDAIVPSIPFAFILLFLVYYVARTGRVTEGTAGAGVLDEAIGSGTGEAAAVSQALVGAASRRARFTWQGLGVILIAAIAISPTLFNGIWLNLAANGLALAVALLSYTIVTGEGGMIWLCQITFAGGGAILGAQLATNHGWPPLLAAIVAGLAMAPAGVIVGALTIRLGDLYVALVTLSFGLLIFELVFLRQRFSFFGEGVDFARPGFAQSDRKFAYLTLVVFAIFAVLILNFRRSTTGMALSAVRWSEPAAETLGLSVVWMKVITAGVAASVAGIGGAFIAMCQQSAQPTSFDVFTGLVWLAVLVTIGLRSITAALIAGLAYTMLGNVFTTYLSSNGKWLFVPALLFGLGAVGVARNPEGVLMQQVRLIQRLTLRGSGIVPAVIDPPDAPGQTMPAPAPGDQMRASSS